MLSIMFRERIIPLYTRLLIVFHFIGTYLLFKFVNDFHPDHLVDESFHLDVAMKYCQESYSYWPDQVTQNPGMYWVSVVILKYIKIMIKADTCNIFFLRMVNYIFGVCNTPLFGYIIKKICERKACFYEQGTYNSTISTVNHGMFPILYFYTFFYYSEPMSVFTVFLMYYFYLKGRHTVAAYIGFLSIMINQSNVVWVGFINMLQFMTAILYDMRKWDDYRPIVDSGRHVPIMKILARHTAHVFVTCDQLVKKHLFSVYSFVCAIFLFTVVVYEGISISNLVAHSFDIHIPQLLYFCLFYVTFSPCAVVMSIPKFLKCIMSAKKVTILVVVSLAIIIYCNTHSPLELADIRPYEYYVWKQLYKGNVLLRYLLIPLYMLGGYTIICKLKDEKTPFILAYIPAIVLLLVKQGRFDFRYFIIPYLFLTVHSSKRHILEVFIESVYYISINVFVFIFFFTQ